ncbi:MAG: hypothetical protein WC919_03285 [Candidatus Paceibacterota bacterium]|jgi:hypothetical protein
MEDTILNDPKFIASLISESIDVSPERLLQEFISYHESIYYESFHAFCDRNGISVDRHEFTNLLATDQSHLFHEYSDKTGQYWVPAITEGYVSNVLPGDWDDFGDDQIEGITKPAFGDSAQQQPMAFEPLCNDQIDAQAEDEEEIEPEEPDPPDFDTRLRHRPSRDVKELEGGVGLYEHDAGNYGPLISRLYGLVDSWQNGAMDQPSFERELHKISSDPTLKNSSIDPWAMVQKILAIKSAS